MDGEFVVIGENKSLNNVDSAEEELVQDYLSNKAWPDYGIATDGFEWVVYRAEHGGDFLEFDEVERIDLRAVINAVARERGHLGSGTLNDAVHAPGARRTTAGDVGRSA